MNLYIVTDEDNLYGERVGSKFSETREHIWLDLGDDTVQFLKTEVAQII